MTHQKLHYEGLGQLLASAGVKPDDSARMIADLFSQETRATHSELVREISDLVGIQLAVLGAQQRSVQADAERLIAKIRIDLEIYQRILSKDRETGNRLIIAVVAMQAVLIVAVFAATFALQTMHSNICNEFVAATKAVATGYRYPSSGPPLAQP